MFVFEKQTKYKNINQTFDLLSKVLPFLYMISILLTLHSYFYGLNDRNHYKGKKIFLWFFTNTCAYTLEYAVNLWIICRKKLGFMPNPKGEINPNIVVSFTSFSARIKYVWMVVDSILRQNMRPQHILLWLSEENFPQKEKQLPQNLLDYLPLGLEICWIKEDLKPHKKYFYTFQKYPSAYVITIDDDIYYRADLISSLWKLHNSFPYCIVGHRGLTILPNKPYINWGKAAIQEMTPSHSNLLTGCGGILYPVNLFDLNKVCDKHLILSTSLQTDDLWLKAMELIHDIPVVIGRYYSNAPTIIGSKKSALVTQNCNNNGEGENDKAWANLESVLHVNELIESKVLE